MVFICIYISIYKCFFGTTYNLSIAKDMKNEDTNNSQRNILLQLFIVGLIMIPFTNNPNEELVESNQFGRLFARFDASKASLTDLKTKVSLLKNALNEWRKNSLETTLQQKSMPSENWVYVAFESSYRWFHCNHDFVRFLFVKITQMECNLWRFYIELLHCHSGSKSKKKKSL